MAERRDETEDPAPDAVGEARRRPDELERPTWLDPADAAEPEPPEGSGARPEELGPGAAEDPEPPHLERGSPRENEPAPEDDSGRPLP